MSAMASQITSLTIVYLRRRSKKTLKLPVTGLCDGNSPVIGEFPTQMASNAENVSIWWRHYDCFTDDDDDDDKLVDSDSIELNENDSAGPSTSGAFGARPYLER